QYASPWPRRHRVPAVHRRHHRGLEGRDAAPPNVIAALLQYKAWLAPLMGEERAVIITALPLYHIFSLTVNCLVMMVVGGENVLITNPRDIPGFVKELAKHRYSMI